MIDVYCEHASGPLAQPLNVASNAAFFIAAFFAWRRMRRDNITAWPLYILLALLLSIGAGSTLYHAAESPATMLADVLPILFFQLLYIPSYTAARGWRLKGCAMLLAGYAALVVIAEQAPHDWLNGSMGYLPALAFLLGLGLWHASGNLPRRFALVASAGVFTLSLLCRSADQMLCAGIPFGVHFAWHILNGAVLYLALTALISAQRLASHEGTAPRYAGPNA